MADEIKIGDKIIGKNHPVFIIAEIGSNFENLQQAKESIKAAKDCGVDSVKFQTYKAENLVIKNIQFPKEAGGRVQYELFKETELSEEAHKELFEYSKNLGLIVFSTPSHPRDVDLLERLGVEVYKIGSDDLTNLPLMDYVAKKGKPVIISTGMGTFEEVKAAVETIRKAGNDNIVVLQCVSNYPVRNLKSINLSVIKSYRDQLDVLSGYSDHSTTTSIPIAAVAFGAVLVEKHFTISKTISAPDAFHSADINDMKLIVQGIREVEAAIGDGVKRPMDNEIDMRRDTRKSLVSIQDIKKGTIISKSDIDVKRPGYGIPPKALFEVLGKKAKVDIPSDTVLQWEYTE